MMDSNLRAQRLGQHNAVIALRMITDSLMQGRRVGPTQKHRRHPHAHDQRVYEVCDPRLTMAHVLIVASRQNFVNLAYFQ